MHAANQKTTNHNFVVQDVFAEQGVRRIVFIRDTAVQNTAGKQRTRFDLVGFGAHVRLNILEACGYMLSAQTILATVCQP